MAKPAKLPSTRLSVITSVVQRMHQRPATHSWHQQFHLRRRPVPYHPTEYVRTGGDNPRQRNKGDGRVIQIEPSASEARKDPVNGVQSKDPPSRPETSHLERTEAGTYSHPCLPWHHIRPLTDIPKPLSEDARKTPAETTSWRSCMRRTGARASIPTATPDLYMLSGIALPEIRRSVHSQNKRNQKLTEQRHRLHHQQPVNSRLCSRSSFISTSQPLLCKPAEARFAKWQE